MSLFAMGLNHETQENFKPTDDIIITPTDVNAATGPSVVIGTDIPAGAADPAGVAALDNFEDFDIILETGDELTKEQVRLEDIAQVVMANETISHTEVTAILAMLPADKTEEGSSNPSKFGSGFLERFTEKLPLASFTEAPSSVNVKETKAFVRKELTINLEKLSAISTEFLNVKAADFVQRAERLLVRLHQAIEAHTAWAVECEALLNQALNSKSHLAYWVQENTSKESGEVTRSNTLIDVRHVPLGDYKFSKILEEAIGGNACFFSAVSEFLSTETGKSMLAATARGNQYDYSLQHRGFSSLVEQFGVGPEYVSSLSLTSYVEILSFFSRREIVGRLETMALAVEQKLELLKQALGETPLPQEIENRFKEPSTVVQFIQDSVIGMRNGNTFVYATDSFRDVFKPVTVAMSEWLNAK